MLQRHQEMRFYLRQWSFQKAGSWIVFRSPRLEVSNDTRHRTMLGHRHDRWQWNSLFASFSDKARAQAVGAKVALQSCQPGLPHDDRRLGTRQQGRADALLPKPSKDRPS